MFESIIKLELEKDGQGPQAVCHQIKVDGQSSIPEAPKDTGADLATRLASLSEVEYDRCRAAEAAKAGIRVGTLDKLVQEKRSQCNRDEAPGQELLLPEVTPWTEEVDMAALLNQVAETIRSYVVLPNEAADVVALWCAHAHVYEAFHHTPRLTISAPEKGCGKTTLRDIVGLFVPRPLLAENMSTATLFRVIDQYRPTILLDEFDAWVMTNQELRGIVNSGHGRKGNILRCVSKSQEIRAFRAFAPMALAGIGTLPETILDRSIVIRLARAKPGEVKRRFDSRLTEEESILCRKLARWCGDNQILIESTDPVMPPNANNRLADNWRPLFAISQLAGGDWPSRAQMAFAKLTQCKDRANESIGSILLRDMRSIFGTLHVTRILSADLCARLGDLEGHPWLEYGRSRKRISPTQLADLLRPYGIVPKSIKLPGNIVNRGYYLEDCQEVFDRFAPATEDSCCYPATKAVNIDDSALSNPLPDVASSGPTTVIIHNKTRSGSEVAALNKEDPNVNEAWLEEMARETLELERVGRMVIDDSGSETIEDEKETASTAF